MEPHLPILIFQPSNTGMRRCNKSTVKRRLGHWSIALISLDIMHAISIPKKIRIYGPI